MLTQASGGDDSDFGSPKENHALGSKSNCSVDSQTHKDSSVPFNELLERQKKCNDAEIDSCSRLNGCESQRSVGEILSSMDHGPLQSLAGSELCVEKPNKLTSSGVNMKKSIFWSRNNVS